MSERTETEIKKMTKEEAYLTGYSDCKSDMLSVVKQTLYYNKMEVPARVRIKSEKLALDHTFEPDSCSDVLDVSVLKKLLEVGIADDVLIRPKSKSAYFNGNEGLVEIDMWISLRDVDRIEYDYWDEGMRPEGERI